MGLFLAVAVVGSGAAVAGLVMLAFLIARKERERSEQTMASPGREAIAASILFHILRSGGATDDDALRLVREAPQETGAVTRDIDLPSWASEFARTSSGAERWSLLDAGVQAAVREAAALSHRQYNALLELSFGLGFQTDALARLRARYRFEYIDHARESRPRRADRAGGGVPLYARRTVDRDRLSALLGLPATFTRRELISAYRRTAATYHPDRFHAALPEQQRTAAEHFIESTDAYEQLLPLCGED